MVNLKNAIPKLILTVALVVSSMSVAVAGGNNCGGGNNKSGSGCSKDKGGTKETKSGNKDKGSKSGNKDKGSKSGNKDKGSKSGGTKTVSATPTPAVSAIPCEPPTGPTPAPSSIKMVYGFGVEVVSFQEIPVDSGNPAPAPSDNAAGGA